jgi:hypothetical protein
MSLEVRARPRYSYFLTHSGKLRENVILLWDLAEASGKMLVADQGNRPKKVCFHCGPNCPFNTTFKLSSKKNMGKKWDCKYEPCKDHCEGAQYDKQKSHTATSSQFSPLLYDMLRSNATMTGEVAGKLLQLYLHSLPGKMFVK